MNKKGNTQEARSRLLAKAQQGKKEVSTQPQILIPLSGRSRPDRSDTEILLSDRESLEAIVTAIMANGRLATLIVHAYLSKYDYQMAPREWLEQKLELARSG